MPQFTNPVVRGVAPDPSVCRVDNDYFLATSTFDFWPGIAIRHSTDLVNWNLIGHAATRPEQFRRNGEDGPFILFAPTLRHHDGTFFVTCTNSAPQTPELGRAGGTVGNFILHAEDPAGPWSDAAWVDAQAFDPSLTFADSTCYYTRRSFTTTKDGLRLGPIVQGEVDPFTGKLTREMSPVSPVTGGFCSNDIEGPHLYKIGDTYYLFSAEGGTEHGHMQTCARSTSPWGPFEPAPHNPVLTHRDRVLHPIQCTGHAELVQAPDDSWWALFLGTRHQRPLSPHLIGRETFLAPVRWQDGWPVIGNDGTAELVMDAPAPRAGTWRSTTAPTAWTEGWNTRQHPVPGLAIDPARSRAELPVTAHTLDEQGPVSAAFLRQLDDQAALTATLATPPAGAEAGITVYTAPEHHYDLYIRVTGEGREAVLRRRAADLVTTDIHPLPGDGPVTLGADCDGATYRFTARTADTRLTIGSGSAVLLDTRLVPGFPSVRWVSSPQAGSRASRSSTTSRSRTSADHPRGPVNDPAARRRRRAGGSSGRCPRPTVRRRRDGFRLGRPKVKPEPEPEDGFQDGLFSPPDASSNSVAPRHTSGRWLVCESVTGREGYEGGPCVRRERELRAARIFRVSDVHGARRSRDLHARWAVVGAVAALDPLQRGAVSDGGLEGHVSPRNFSMKAIDSRGVRACARMIPYRISRIWTSIGRPRLAASPPQPQTYDGPRPGLAIPIEDLTTTAVSARRRMYEVGPRRRRERELRTLLVLGVADVDRATGRRHLDALRAVVAAVAALDPLQRETASGRGLEGHVSSRSFSMKANDSLGVSACARMIPYRISRIWTSFGSENRRLHSWPSQWPTAPPLLSFSS